MSQQEHEQNQEQEHDQEQTQVCEQVQDQGQGNRRRRRGRRRQRRGGKIRSMLPLILSLALLVLGAGIFFYPAISNFIADLSHREMITSHANMVSSLDEETLEEEWQKAIEYNENLMGDPVHDPFIPGSGYAIPDNYQDVLALDDVMCTLEIPKIGLSLPVYHGTSEEVLAKGIGHMEVTALPIGGLNRHTVLTGHRGLPSAELFTRLDEMEIGDHFYIHVLDEVHAYQVDQITTVEPDELENLVAEADKDLVTLVTCTPYAVNTHRLLVRGTRVEYDPEVEQQEDEVTLRTLDFTYLWYYIPGAVVGVGLIVGIVVWRRRKKRREG